MPDIVKIKIILTFIATRRGENESKISVGCPVKNTVLYAM